jgi:ABC-type phosphate transport system substrate-binding protein
MPVLSFKRAAVGAGAAASLLLAGATLASADFETAKLPCTGESVQGRGASFQNNAAKGFIAVFASADGCGAQVATVPQVSYDPAGSGAGRGALGVKTATNPNQDRDPVVRFAGSDEPPTPAERQQMEKGAVDANGADVTAADDGALHVIPVAIGAVTVVLHLPDGCTYNAAGNKPLDGNRPAMTNATLEKVFAGEITTWGDAIPGIGCANAAITRVVRLDSSGTTFALKQFLAAVNPTRGWAALGNTEWPNNPNDTRVARGASNGNGPLATKLKATQGGIGYGDLGGIRGAESNEFTWTDANDTTFWVPLQRQTTATYDDPQTDTNGYKKGATTRGAACTTVTPRNVPTTPAATPSLGDWSQVDSTYSATGYGACTLTYDLAFDDNSTVFCNSAAEERKARTVKDYLSLGALSVKGQQSATTTDYDSLPGFNGATTPVAGSLYAIARAAVDSIGWKKNGGGRPCAAAQQPTPEPTASPQPTAGPQATVTPPPPAPSNAFTISSARASGTSIRLSLQLPGAGKISVASSTKPKKGKAINLAAKSVAVTKAGAQTVTVSLSAKAKTALKKDKKLKVTLKVTFTPTGGTAKTVTKSVTVKRAKKK